MEKNKSRWPHGHVLKSWVVLVIVAGCCGPIYGLQERKLLDDLTSEWSQPIGGLMTRLKVNSSELVAGDQLDVELFFKGIGIPETRPRELIEFNLRESEKEKIEPGHELQGQEQNDAKYLRLLQGRFVFVFTPASWEKLWSESDAATIIAKSFSGAGGIDYDGKTGMKYQLTAPRKPGQYFLLASVVSGKEDVQYFRTTAKMKNSEYWSGSLASMPILITVSENKADSVASLDIGAEVEKTFYKFVCKPVFSQSRIADDSRLGWHSELYLTVNGISISIASARTRAKLVPPYGLDADQVYEFNLERIERFADVSFDLVSIAKDGVNIYSRPVVIE